MLMDLRNTIDAKAPLGQKSSYPTSYDKSLLFPVARAKQREAMKMPHVTFEGFDVWNAYELLWHNEKGKPVRSCATIVVPAMSPNLCESKSVKLYLNSFNKEPFLSSYDVALRIKNDLSEICQQEVEVYMGHKSFEQIDHTAGLEYRCLDDLDIEVKTYQRNESLLTADPNTVASEKLVTHLFKSHCLCTGQPDMGSIFIHYVGPKIHEPSLLAYLLSYGDHVGFSENCIEQIFVDLIDRAMPEKLVVFGRFTRRGGIDINPYRSTHAIPFANQRLIYQ